MTALFPCRREATRLYDSFNVGKETFYVRLSLVKWDSMFVAAKDESNYCGSVALTHVKGILERLTNQAFG